MNTPVIRDLFSEGLILSAAQLQGLSEQPRARSERHNNTVHRWGIAKGLTLRSALAEDTFGNAYVRVFLEPGLAIDGHGREVLLTDEVELNAARFQLTIGNGVAEDTDYPVFIVSEYHPIDGQSTAMTGCMQGTSPQQVEERVGLRFGQPGDETLEQQAPVLSADPSPAQGSTDWLIFVGYVNWTVAAKAFAEPTEITKQKATQMRPAVGVNATTVAGNDATVQIQPKGDLLAGDTVLQVNQTANGPELCFGTFTGPGKPVDPLLKINAKGDVVAKGALTGKQTGNSVQMESGIASDGMILPLPPGVTQQQVDDGDATLHIQVTPRIAPEYAPDGVREYAAWIQECRVDADRRVRCRLVWVSLPLGPNPQAIGTTMFSGPGAVDFIVTAATIEVPS